MDLQLNGKRALITGSTVGIGFAIAKALAEEGVQVVVNGRTEERVSEAQRRIATEISNARIEGVAADLSSPDGVSKVIEAFPEMDKLFFEKARPSSLLKRFIQPEEVASLVAYVCSPLSAATNGAALRVEGGVVQSIF